MRWWPATADSLWRQQLSELIGGWVLLFLRQPSSTPGSTPGHGVGLAGRVIAVDRQAVRLGQMGSEYVVPLAEILYILKPGPTQQDEMSLAAMTATELRKGA